MWPFRDSQPVQQWKSKIRRSSVTGIAFLSTELGPNRLGLRRPGDSDGQVHHQPANGADTWPHCAGDAAREPRGQHLADRAPRFATAVGRRFKVTGSALAAVLSIDQ